MGNGDTERDEVGDMAVASCRAPSGRRKSDMWASKLVVGMGYYI
jgi:hypothetical protein